MLSGPLAFGRGEYQAPDAFIDEVFDGDVPKPKVVWLTKSLKDEVVKLLGHAPRSLRVRYWGRDHRTAWILEEIGKEKPITVGVVVKAGKIERLKVLIFRESRGGEVRYPFFTQQFSGVALGGSGRLDRSIDGISGATLSVRALKKVARLALLLHQQTPFAHDPQ